MNFKVTPTYFFLPILILILALNQSCTAHLGSLQHWLATPVTKKASLEKMDFAYEVLSKGESKKAIELLMEEKQKTLLQTYGSEWDERLLSINDLEAPFFFSVFGDLPAGGRSLFISLHGGGGAPDSVNDQQYENQKHLYDATMKNMEGVYLAVRAPTNTWDLWHQQHIDDFLSRIIELAVIKENVNPNKVYILGYSAGGDGLFQLAPRMADRWAAASMMAGHPGDASPLNLRNTAFAVHMGALDDAYNRNGLAREWKSTLDTLRQNNPDGYIHDVQVHEGLGHWMKLKDAVALPWMQQYKRNPIPKKVVWKQDNRHHTHLYWLGTPKESIQTGGQISVEYNTALNEINIMENYSSKLQLFLNDSMVDLDKPVSIKYQGRQIYLGGIKRSILNIQNSILNRGDVNFAFPAMITVVNNQSVKQ